MEAQIITLALAATTIVKALVDVLRMGWSSPAWAPPTLAMLGGIVVVLLLMVASGEPISQQAGAQAVLAGILAGGSAVGVTELQRRTRPGK
jgi:hypothetical protein